MLSDSFGFSGEARGRLPEGPRPRGAFAELQWIEDHAGAPRHRAPLDVDKLSLPRRGFQPRPRAISRGLAAPS
eukprot:5701953-Pyramimonas_sp.AAC.1